MGGRAGSTVRRRMLARELRLLRAARGLGLEAAAAKLDCAPSTLSRCESGNQVISVSVVKNMLDLYEAGDRWEELVELARAVRQRGWWQGYGLGSNSYVGLEHEATRIRDFTTTYVPGLLQTAAYARAMLAAGEAWGSGQRLEDAVAVRMIRQERLVDADAPLHLDAIVDEAALYRPVGGPDVHRAQLEYLFEAAQLPTVALQVLPFRTGVYPTMASPFTVLSFDHLGEPDIAYVEHALGAATLDQEPDVTRARLFFDRLRAEALGYADSAALIRAVLDAAGRAREEGHDGHPALVHEQFQ